MTDAVAVFDPGFRVTDNTTGDALSGAVIRFYDAGTTTPKTVYSDADLSTALGTSVTCDSLGYPTSNGTTKTLVYVGIAPYKITIETSAGVVIASHDNVKGAVATVEASDASVITTTPVVTKSLDYTVVLADQNTFFKTNCSSADVTLTLPSAVEAGDGWGFPWQHAGSANQALIATVSGQKIFEGSHDFGTKFSLALNGEDCWVVSDGGNWVIRNHTTPMLKNTQGVLPIIDRVTSAPGTPVQGGLYLVTSAYSTFSTNDIIQYTGASYVAFTPYTDCGWIAYVADEDLNYQFQGSAWVVETASTSRGGTARLADAAAMEALTSGRVSTADIQHRHPGHPKAWALFDGTGTPALTNDYGVASITDNGTGDYTLAVDTAFSSTGYATPGMTSHTGTSSGRSLWNKSNGTLSVTQIQIISGIGDDEGNIDCARGSVSWFGDQ